MSNEVTKAKGTAVSADLMDDIFESAGEGASFDSSEMQIPSSGWFKPCHHRSTRRNQSI